VTRLVEETGADIATVAKAFAVTRDAFGLPDLNLAIDDLGGAVPGQTQLGLYAVVQDLLTDRMVWFIRNLDLAGDIAPVVSRYRDGIAATVSALPAVLGGAALKAIEARQAELVRLGLRAEAARVLAAVRALAAAPDIVYVAEASERPVADVAGTHFALERAFGLDALVAGARAVPVADTYDQLVLERAVGTILAVHRRLTAEVLGEAGAGSRAVAAWSEARGAPLARVRQALEVATSTGLTVSKATFAAGLLTDLARPRDRPA